MNHQAQKQLAPWIGHGVRSKEDLVSALNRESAFLVEIKDNTIHCDYKLTHLIFAQRMQKYHEFFNSICERFVLPDILFSLDVGDEAEENKECPIFSFQRKIGSKNILLPDNDFVITNCYSVKEQWGLPDTRKYKDKLDRAVFAGSTTGGGHITAALLASGAVPRIEAARFFRNSLFVDFRLPNIVQCNEEAAHLLQAEGFGQNPTGWDEQLRSKFVISIDGNGATCSRVYISLASNSVLLKYKSNYEMFYFDGMVEGEHYIGINKHEDVLEIIQKEVQLPGTFEKIARNGKIFADRYLSRGALEAYTADLFWAYACAA